MSPRESHDDLDPGSDSAEDLLQELQGNPGQPPLTPKALHQLVQGAVRRLWREGSFPVAPPAGSVWAVCLLPEETTVQVVRWDELPPPVRALEALALAPLPVLTFYFGRGVHGPGAVELGECAHPLFRPPAESSSRLSDALDGAMAAGHFAQPPPPGTAWVLTGRPHRVLAHPPGTGKVLGLRLTVTAEPLGALDPRLVRYVQPGAAQEDQALVLLTADDGGEPWESGVFYLAEDPHLTVAPRGTA